MPFQKIIKKTRKEPVNSAMETVPDAIPADQLLLIQDCTPVIKASVTGAKPKNLFIDTLHALNNPPTYRAINRDTKTWYVKGSHHNRGTVSEVLSGKLYQLSGLAGPYTKFGKGFEHSTPLSHITKNRLAYETTSYFVASQRLKGFFDLIYFIDHVHASLEDYLPYESHEAFKAYYQKLKALEPAPDPASYKVEKSKLTETLFNMLPEELHDQLYENYIISIWLNNWDFLNWDQQNMGFRVRVKAKTFQESSQQAEQEKAEQQEKVLSVESAFVDFGNCLWEGYRGEHKKNSLEAANSAAKTKDAFPTDYDPPPFGNEDLKKAQRIASIKQPPIEEKTEDSRATPSHKEPEKPEAMAPSNYITIQPWATRFDKTCPMIRLGNVPRRGPFTGLVRDIDRQIGDILSDKKNQAPLAKGVVRGLYRLSLISDEAIRNTVDKWYLLGEGKPIKPHPSKPAPYTKEELTCIMQQRRNYLISLFKQEIKSYLRHYPNEALQVESEAKRAQWDVAELIPPPNKTGFSSNFAEQAAKWSEKPLKEESNSQYKS